MKLKPKPLCWIVIFFLLSVWAGPETVGGEEPLPSTITVGLDDSYPPYVFRDSHGRLQGMVVDQWKLWEQQTGIKAELQAMDWAHALDGALAGRFDVIDTVFKNPERKQYLSFTRPYAAVDVVIFFHRNISGVTGVESLKGFTVGVKKGDNCIQWLREKGVTDLLEFSSYERIVKAAEERKIVVWVMDKPPALYYLYKMNIHNQFKSSPTPLYSGQFHRAVRKDDWKTLNIVQAGFDRIPRRQYRALETKWMGRSYDSGGLLVHLALGIGAALLIAVLLLFWNFSLRKMVRLKTKELLKLVGAVGQRERRLQALLNAIPDVVFILDRQGVFRECYARDESQLLFPREFHYNKSFDELFPEDLTMDMSRTIATVLATGETVILERPFETGRGVRYLEARLVPFEEEQVLMIVRDTTAKKMSERKIYEMSIRDNLTGLFNRNYFESAVNGFTWDQAANIALVVCDLDGLKLINDTFGHHAGDQCLKTVGAELLNHFRATDVVARIGGDEFAVIMKDTTVEAIRTIRANLKNSLKAVAYGDSVLPVSLSLGYSWSDDSGMGINTLYKEADDYMYRQKLHQRQSVRSEIVNVLLKMMEARDFNTEGHGERLQRLAGDLAERIGLKEQDINDIRLFAQFHDIGKVGIADSLLFKPGKLTPVEFEEMKRHSEIGFRIANSIPDLLHIADWIYRHHEWWNGCGYPLGLKGEGIPAACRILSIVDAYDAMTSDRPYRRALPMAAALKELKRCAGTQFDPEFVEFFIGLITSPDPIDSDRCAAS